MSSVTWRFNPLSRRVGLLCFGFISPCLPACHVQPQEWRRERLNLTNLFMRIELGMRVRLAISGSGSNFDVADTLLQLLRLQLLHDFFKERGVRKVP